MDGVKAFIQEILSGGARDGGVLEAARNRGLAPEAALQVLARVSANLATLQEVSRALSSELNLDRLLQTIMAKTTEVMRADRSTLFLLDEEKGQLWSKVAQGITINEIRFPKHLGIAGHVCTTGETLNIPEAYDDPRFNKEVDKKTGYRTKTILCMPVKNKEGKTLGVVQVLNKKDGAFTEEDEDLLRAFTSPAAIAIENSRLFEAVEKARRRTALMLDVANALTSQLELTPLLQTIMAKTTEVMRADRSTLFLLDEEKGELWSKVAQGLNVNEIRFPKHLGIAGHVCTTGETLNIPEAYDDPRFNKEVDKKTGYRTKTILCMPVKNKEGKTLGVTQVLNKKDGVFTEEDEDLLRAFTSQAAIAIENSQLFEHVLYLKNYNESILESISNGVLTLDKKGRIITANTAFQRVFAAREEDLLGVPYGEFFGEKNTRFTKLIASVFETGQTKIDLDTDYTTREGRPVSMNLVAVPLIDRKGENIGIVMSAEDITKEKRIMGTLSRYMTKEVADKVLSEKGEAILGGEYQEVTILFSDVRSYTSLTEKMEAGEVMDMLNQYFSHMVDCVFRYEGVLDKYIGDAIMAVFGAPLPHEDDPLRGARVALEMQRELAKFNQARKAAGKMPIKIGLGLSTGMVVSGNLGSNKRMDYTVIGDAVNLASRLESATKQYKVGVMLAETTYEPIRGKVVARELDLMRVKGKLQPTKVYELLAEREGDLEPARRELLAAYAGALSLYKERRWEEARAAFERCCALDPEDGPSKIYLERCGYFLANPPGPDWDGVWVLAEK